MTPRGLRVLAVALAARQPTRPPDGPIPPKVLEVAGPLGRPEVEEARAEAGLRAGESPDLDEEYPRRIRMPLILRPMHLVETPEQLQETLANLESDSPPEGSPHRAVLDDFEQLNALHALTNDHMAHLEHERQHLMNMRTNHQDRYNSDEQVMTAGTSHMERVGAAVSEMAQSWLDRGEETSPRSKPAPELKPADPDAPPASIMAADADESSLLEVAGTPYFRSAEAQAASQRRSEDARMKDEWATLVKRLAADAEGKPIAGPLLEPSGDLDRRTLDKYHLEALENPPKIPTIPHLSFHIPWTKSDDHSAPKHTSESIATDLTDPSSLLQLDFRRRRVPAKFALGGPPEPNTTDASTSSWTPTGNYTLRTKLQEIAETVGILVGKAENTTKLLRAHHAAKATAFDGVAASLATNGAVLAATAKQYQKAKKDERRRRAAPVSVLKRDMK